MGKSRKILSRIVRWLLITLLIIIGLFIILVLAIRTPWAQNKITTAAINYAEGKTGTEFNIDRLFVTFRGDIQLEGLYAENLTGDTLLYSESLETGVAFLPLLRGNIHISRIDWSGLQASVNRNKNGGFDFQFIIDAFSVNDTTSIPAESTSTEKKLPGLKIGPVSFENFDLVYLDSTLGIDAMIQLGSLSFDVDALDIKNMTYAVDELEIINVKGHYHDFGKPRVRDKTVDTNTVSLPFLAWQHLHLENVDVEYKSEKLELFAAADIGLLDITTTSIDLKNRYIPIDELELKKSRLVLSLPVNSEKMDTATQINKAFQYPDWHVIAAKIDMAENHLQLDMGDDNPSEGLFDPNHIAVEDFGLQLHDALYQEELGRLSIDRITFKERSGFSLTEFSGDFDFTNSSASVKNLIATTNNNHIQTSAHLEFPVIDSLLKAPLEQQLQIIINKGTYLSLKDAFFFDEQIRSDSLLSYYSKFPVRIDADVVGKKDHIEINSLHVSAFSNTEFSAHGLIRGLPDTNSIYLKLPSVKAKTTAADLALLTDTSGFKLPEWLSMEASATGNIKKLLAEIYLNSNFGGIDIEGEFRELDQTPEYKGVLALHELNLQSFGVSDLEPVILDIEFDGRGLALDQMELHSTFDIEKLIYRKFDYSKLNLEADIIEKRAVVKMSHYTQDLNFELAADAILDTAETKAEIKLDLKGIDLQEMNLYNGSMKAAFRLHSTFKGNTGRFESKLDLAGGIFKSNDVTYRLDSIFAIFNNSTDSSYLNIDSEIITGEIAGNTSIDQLNGTVRAYIRNSLRTDSLARDSLNPDISLAGHFELMDSPIITELLIPDIERFENISITADFNPSKEILKLQLNSAYFQYEEFILENFNLDLNASHDSVKADLNFDHFERAPIDMFRTTLDVDLYGSRGNASFTVLDEGDSTVFNTSVGILRTANYSQYTIVPDKFILNHKHWDVNKENYIRIEDHKWRFNKWELSKDSTSISADNDEADDLNINFTNFALNSFFSILNDEESPVSGDLNGNLKIKTLTNGSGFIADVYINHLSVRETEIGKLSLLAKNPERENFLVDLQLKGPELDMGLSGNYRAESGNEDLNLKLALKNLQTSLLEKLAPRNIDSGKGSISADINVSGDFKDPDYNGTLEFRNVAFNPVKLGAYLSLRNEKLSLSNKMLTLKNFTILDARNNPTKIDGQVNLEKPLNPGFDLQVQANKFRVLNSTANDNKLFYGHAVVDLDIKLTGDLDNPVVDARAKLTDETDVTYVIPKSEASMENRGGVVQFRNMKDSLDVFSKTEQIEIRTIKGFNVDAILNLSPGTRFKIIVDPRSGDNLTLAGEANLNYTLRPNGNMNLTGNYLLNKGGYQLNLYELVKKKFDIRSGSKITWHGQPTNADLDITAVYETSTSASSLMDNPGSKYNQNFTFQVLLYITGTINEPKISFGLDMPKNQRDAVSGTVYSKIRQLNQDEGELNKQVFALIVFDRFIPSRSSGETEISTSDIARSSVSDFLSSQLNSLSNKYLQGVELNVNLSSYTDYAAGYRDERTDLSVSLKKGFFDERVILEVGGNVNVEGQKRGNDIAGDVALEYLLTEDGTYRVRGFRNNEYQDVIEGQVIITGLGLIFSKEFTTWDDFWKARDKKDKNSEEDEKQNDEGIQNKDDEEDGSNNNDTNKPD